MTLADELSRPEAYPSHAPARIERIETHISWIFRLEREVFKVKKPVSLGFLDFTTLEARRRACDAEVRLNARLSPDVYLGVEAVRRGPDGLATIGGGEGEVVDFAVRMRRLPDARRADRLLEEGALGPAAVDAIAGRIARFHAACRSDARTAGFGQPAAIAVNVEENFEQTRGSLLRFLSPAEAERIVRWQRGQLDGKAAAFEARAAAGKVRDGHGDLRLEHVYLDPERPEARLDVLDCIEFNDRFRFADVCADLAFLSMDLAAHGRVDLAERLLARYARESGDFDLYAVVDFYEAYRAFVRGKIASIVAGADGATEEIRRRAGAEARRHFLLALAAARPPLVPPSLVAVGGVIASGKSTIADHLSFELGAPVVDADRTRKSMLGVEPETPLLEGAFSGAYAPGFSEQVYAEVLRRAEVVLASGRPVVVDASFRSERERARARALAARLGVPFRFVECRAPAELSRARLARRAREQGVSDGRAEIFDAFCARFEAVSELPSAEHVAIDTSRPLEESLEILRRLAGTWPAGLVA